MVLVAAGLSRLTWRRRRSQARTLPWVDRGQMRSTSIISTLRLPRKIPLLDSFSDNGAGVSHSLGWYQVSRDKRIESLSMFCVVSTLFCSLLPLYYVLLLTCSSCTATFVCNTGHNFGLQMRRPVTYHTCHAGK